MRPADTVYSLSSFLRSEEEDGGGPVLDRGPPGGAPTRRGPTLKAAQLDGTFGEPDV